MEIKKYGAIDIGSNAIRLLISNVIIEKNKAPLFKKSSLVRVPIRLGADSFTTGKISKNNTLRLADAVKAFGLLMKVNGVEKYKACATSAMREASNGKEVIKIIREKTGVNIEVISGKKEAAIISSTDLRDLIKTNNNYLYVDVGGGSTEFTLFSKGKIINSKSFKIGTVRLLSNSEEKNELLLANIEKWIKQNMTGLKKLSLIGSGGNINKIFKMSGKQQGKPLSYSSLQSQYQFLKSKSYKEKVTELGLNPDRADVIVPATKIYLSAMKWGEAKKIFIPKIGLADGIVKNLYNNNL